MWTDKHFGCLGFFPEMFLSFGVVRALYKNQSRYLSQIYYVEKKSWTKTSLYLYLCVPHKLPYVVDGLQYRRDGATLTLQYNYNFMLTDTRLHLYTEVSESQFFCESISGLFPSTIWLERELSEFTGLVFEGLQDNRRLLLDYFHEKHSPQTHVDNERSYSNVIYEVSLNF